MALGRRCAPWLLAMLLGCGTVEDPCADGSCTDNEPEPPIVIVVVTPPKDTGVWLCHAEVQWEEECYTLVTELRPEPGERDVFYRAPLEVTFSERDPDASLALFTVWETPVPGSLSWRRTTQTGPQGRRPSTPSERLFKSMRRRGRRPIRGRSLHWQVSAPFMPLSGSWPSHRSIASADSSPRVPGTWSVS